MKIIGINGSPRAGWNSDTLLTYALQWAVDAGGETERIPLTKLRFSGCVSCFCCKRLDAGLGKCAIQDELTPILSRVRAADMLIVSTPIYFADVPGQVRNLFERLWFPPYLYRKDGTTAFEKRVKTLLIYSMNTRDGVKYGPLMEDHVRNFERFYGPARYVAVENTLQFSNYSKYTGDVFDLIEKKERHDTVFPSECDAVRKLSAAMLRE